MRHPSSSALVATLVAALILITAAPGFGHDMQTTVPVTEIANGDVVGRSTLVRSDSGVRARIRAASLAPGNAYTVWAVVFNHPEACDGACDAPDLSNPEVGAASVWADGRVARSERVTFAVRMQTTDDLTDPHSAEIHFVVRDHGPALPGLIDEQTTTLNGGCPPNTCTNVLVALH